MLYLDVKSGPRWQPENGFARFQRLDFGQQHVFLEVDAFERLLQSKLRPPKRFEFSFLTTVAR
jgi:hypothetical protein